MKLYSKWLENFKKLSGVSSLVSQELVFFAVKMLNHSIMLVGSGSRQLFFQFQSAAKMAGEALSCNTSLSDSVAMGNMTISVLLTRLSPLLGAPTKMWDRVLACYATPILTLARQPWVADCKIGRSLHHRSYPTKVGTITPASI